MHTKTATPLSIGRREFFASAAGIVATGLAAASPLSLLSGISRENVDLVMPIPTTKRLHLDLHEAKQIAASFGDGDRSCCLMLDYTSASQEAIAHLSSLNASGAILGLESLNPDMANLLAGWKTPHLVFNNLGKLTPEVARHLNLSNHALGFLNLRRLDVKAARYLVGDGYFGELDINIHGVPSQSLVKVLSMHPYDLTLRVASLEPQAAKALSFHMGCYLRINSKAPFSEDTLQAFFGSAMKCLTTDLCDHFYVSGENGYTLDVTTNEEGWPDYRQRLILQGIKRPVPVGMIINYELKGSHV